MPLIDEALAAPALEVTIQPSLAVELTWVLSAVDKPSLRRQPAVASLYERAEGPAAEAEAIWDDAERHFSELLVLADRGGVLQDAEAGIEELLAAVGEAMDAPSGALRLASEGPEERSSILGRLEQLRRSARLRRRYLGLLEGTWAGVAEDWERAGRPAALASARQLAEALRRPGDWLALVAGQVTGSDCLHDCLTAHRGLVETARRVLVVPAAYAGQFLLLDLPGTLLVGVAAGQQEVVRREELARQLKSLADPTRLAILELVARSPRTVGELARAVGLAQPTVSNHVKLLREAGVLGLDRQGGERRLVVEPGRLAALLGEVGEISRPGR